MPEAYRIPRTGSPSLAAGAWAAAAYSVALLLLFHQTAWSMVAIWLRSETFAHGLLIVPISLWLIWRQRADLVSLVPRPTLAVAGLLVFPGLAWLLASMVDVLVIQQLALVTMLVLGVWAILGHAVTRTLMFPLLFLFLAVPMGESLVAPMMEFTATTTVWMVQNSGVPVFREGLYFSLPSGHWSVVEACSGVRYIIASFTLGVLYAYLTYRTLWRRLVFVLASLLVPVIANTLRAYMIVMLGHWSDMTIATGVDHLVYGWVFFGIVMFLLFWVGALFREDYDTPAVTASESVSSPGVTDSRGTPIIVVTLVALVGPAVVLFLAHFTNAGGGNAFSLQQIASRAVSAAGALAEAEPPWQWQPAANVGGQAVAFFPLEQSTVGLYIQYDDGQVSGGEVVGSSARFVLTDKDARVVGLDRVEVQLNGKMLVVDQAQIVDRQGQMLAWSWYRVGNVDTSSDYVAKFAEAWIRLQSGTGRSYRILVAVPLNDSVESAARILQTFLNQHGAQLDARLQPAVEEGQ